MWTASEDEKELEKLCSCGRGKRRAGGSSIVSHRVLRGGGEVGRSSRGGGGGGGCSGKGGSQGVHCNDIEKENGWNSLFPVSSDNFSVPPGDGDGALSQTDLEPK